MRYWWVNQNQTFKQESEGGYIWSPKRNANGARNPFYDNTREAARVTYCSRSATHSYQPSALFLHIATRRLDRLSLVIPEPIGQILAGA